MGVVRYCAGEVCVRDHTYFYETIFGRTQTANHRIPLFYCNSKSMVNTFVIHKITVWGEVHKLGEGKSLGGPTSV